MLPVTEDGGQVAGFLGTNDFGREGKFALENVTVKEENGTEGLILGGGRKIAFGGQIYNECLYFGFAHLAWMTFVMKQNITANPIHVGLFCAIGVVFDAQRIGNLIE